MALPCTLDFILTTILLRQFYRPIPFRVRSLWRTIRAPRYVTSQHVTSSHQVLVHGPTEAHDTDCSHRHIGSYFSLHPDYVLLVSADEKAVTA
jgi:hypothetical protein